MLATKTVEADNGDWGNEPGSKNKKQHGRRTPRIAKVSGEPLVPTRRHVAKLGPPAQTLGQAPGAGSLHHRQQPRHQRVHLAEAPGHLIFWEGTSNFGGGRPKIR